MYIGTYNSFYNKYKKITRSYTCSYIKMNTTFIMNGFTIQNLEGITKLVKIHTYLYMCI